jgi:hypothetical protein
MLATVLVLLVSLYFAFKGLTGSAALYGSIFCSAWAVFSAFTLVAANYCNKEGTLLRVPLLKGGRFASHQEIFIRENLFFFTYPFLVNTLAGINGAFSLAGYGWLGVSAYTTTWLLIIPLTALLALSMHVSRHTSLENWLALRVRRRGNADDIYELRTFREVQKERTLLATYGPEKLQQLRREGAERVVNELLGKKTIS